MRQKRNVKSESEERSIILFEHGKTLCQVENERNIELSFEHRKGRSQAENERNIELSFCNAILRKASVFSKELSENLWLCFFRKVKSFFKKNREKISTLCSARSIMFMATVGRKGRFVRSCPLGRMPLKEELMLCAGHSPKIADKARCVERAVVEFIVFRVRIVQVLSTPPSAHAIPNAS